MRATLKNQWIENLRSGRFQQGHTKLRTHDNKYCCLGVLCETLRENGFPGEWVDSTDARSPYFGETEKRAYAFIRADAERPGELIRDTAFLDVDILLLTGIGDTLMWKLIHMNDAQGMSFSTIAGFIEANVPVTPELASVDAE